MVSPKYPPKGAPAKRRADGLIGEVYVSSPTKDLVAVRWSADDESGTFLYSAEHFARDWELTPTSTSNWKGRAAATALLVIFGTCLYGGLRACESNPASPGPSTSPQHDSAAALADPKALLDKYGAIAAAECSRGADEFVRSVARHGFKWEDVGMFDEKFDEYLTVYVAPGVTTSISDKLFLQDGFGSFKREKLFCTYDTQKKQVLQYWIADSDE
jgi:hypothetical protein